MKIGVSTYSYIRLMKKGGFNELDAISSAKEMGFEIVEFSTLHMPENIDIKTYAKMLSEKCKETGIEVGNYSIGADFLNGCGGDLDKEIDRLKKEVEIARILGSSGMRHDVSVGFPKTCENTSTFEDALPVLIKGCKKVTEYACSYGIRTMVENHGLFCQDSDRVQKLIEGVDHENFGVLLDIGNFLCVDEDPVKAVGKLLPFAFNIHIKDFHIKSGMLPDPGYGWFSTRGGNYLSGAIIGHGEVPVLQCLILIKKNEYKGNIFIEYEGIENVLKGISIGLANLKKYVEMI